jgi:pimeloyl-ACP methyl ester carboxylesterase
MDLGEFPVLGISGGGPYALACAALLDDRVTRAGVGCGVGPMAAIPLGQRTPYYLARYLPPVVRLSLWRRGRTAREDPAAAQRGRAEEAADVDEERWLGEPGQVLVETSVAAAAEHGTAPLAHELALFGSPWDFDVTGIEIPVHLWYGKRDRIVPVEMGLHLAREVPTAAAHFYPDQAHISVVQENREAILDALVEQA